MKQIIFTFSDDSKEIQPQIDSKVLPPDAIQAGMMLIVASLKLMHEMGNPVSRINQIGGDICAAIGKILDQELGDT